MSTQAVDGGRIVVGADGSQNASAALAWAGRQAALTGATLEVVTSWEWPNSFGWALPFPADYSPEVDARKVVDEAVASVRADHPEIAVEGTVAHGHAAAVLVGISEHADLLVVGSRGHGEFVGMLIGSVSEHCVAHARCPVIVVR
jgi:nucleotide-binding universal stress UspA family protein